MRSLFVGIIMLSASMAVVDTAQAQIHRPAGYGSMQAPIGHRQPTQYDSQPTQDDRDKIDKDNQQLDQPASQDEITGAGQVQSREDALTNRIGQDNPALDSEITDICPSCGGAEDAPVHQRSWPIHHGFKHQPTQYDLRALHRQDVTRGQAPETDELYDRLMSNQILGRRPGRAP
jgi:hypothetical protein